MRLLIGMFSVISPFLLGGCVVVPLAPSTTPVATSQVGKTVEFLYRDWQRMSRVTMTRLSSDAFQECRGRYGEPAFCLAHAEQVEIDSSTRGAKAPVLTCVIKASIYAECVAKGYRTTTRETRAVMDRRDQQHAASATMNIGLGAWRSGNRVFQKGYAANSTEECREVEDIITDKMQLLCLPAREVLAIGNKTGRINCTPRPGGTTWSCSAFNKPRATDMFTGNRFIDYPEFQKYTRITVEFHDAEDCRIVTQSQAPFCIDHFQKEKRSSSQRYEFTWRDEPAGKYGGIWQGRRLITN